MTQNQPPPVEAFIARVAAAHSRLGLSCDASERLADSTWIDIRAGNELLVVEYRPDRGFGFSSETPEKGLYGTPSAIFIREIDKALEHFEHMLNSSMAVEVGAAARHGA